MPIFLTPYDQYQERHGQACEIVRDIIEPESDVDAEVLPMYVIRFPDGLEIHAWPEEICDPHDLVAKVKAKEVA